MTNSRATLLVESHKDWWQLIGLETLVDETPVNWLAPPRIADTVVPSPPVDVGQTERPVGHVQGDGRQPVGPAQSLAALAPLAMPSEWSAFQAWLADDVAVPGTRWHPQRILPIGPVAAPLMILALTPEMTDHDAGELFSGDSGRLLDAMLRAIGLTRAKCYLASLALTRPPGGRLDGTDIAALTPLLWHHLALARPARLLMFGSDLAQIITGTELAAARGKLLDVNHHGVNIPAAAIQHPMLLLDRPARKAAAWDSLKLLKP